MAYMTTVPDDVDVSPKTTGPAPASVPIALVPMYQLSLTDVFASRVPIADAYAPVDHWQWMATLWRGVVGPDVTVAVGRGDGGGVKGGVEIRLGDAKAILVREGVGEGVLRRVGFEVGEWVRGLGEGRRGS